MDLSSHSSGSRMRPPAQTIPEEDQSEVNASNGVSPRQNGSAESNSQSNGQQSDGSNRSLQSQQLQQQQSSQQSTQQQQSQSSSRSLNPAPQQPSGAAAAAQQPKVVQTAFIHKLYSMLQDSSIQHLITWSSSNESFLMNPTSEFSKVLSQYFKHTNISSFVRQLNMYGFHKVSDVFHTGSPDSTMWEFKHGNGNFKKGDVASLREIKRRASRHTLIHRDSFSTTSHKLNPNHQGSSHEPQDGPEARFIGLEHSVYDMHSRLNRMEESHALLSSKCQVLTESLIRCHQWTNSMTYYVTSLIPENNPVRQEIVSMQREVSRQLEAVRALDNPHEPLGSRPQPPHYGTMSIDPVSTAPLSPRQPSHDDVHRSNTNFGASTSRGAVARPREVMSRPGGTMRTTRPKKLTSKQPIPIFREHQISAIDDDSQIALQTPNIQ
ncbi:hypothetical protein KEM56_001548 [Ascosphaera pollenicola]|nr:hypothetical protein KEM56_001548 [Ascosphaera pollenicola]